MSVQQARPSIDTTEPTDSAAVSRVPTPGQTEQNAILLADPRGVGYEVELPTSIADPQAVIDTIYADTPFIPYLKPAGKPTTYDSIEVFIEEHPAGDTIRPILD